MGKSTCLCIKFQLLRWCSCIPWRLSINAQNTFGFTINIFPSSFFSSIIIFTDEENEMGSLSFLWNSCDFELLWTDVLGILYWWSRDIRTCNGCMGHFTRYRFIIRLSVISRAHFVSRARLFRNPLTNKINHTESTDPIKPRARARAFLFCFRECYITVYIRIPGQL